MRIRTKEKLVPDAGPYGHGLQIVLLYGYLREAERMLTKQRRAEEKEAPELTCSQFLLNASEAHVLKR